MMSVVAPVPTSPATGADGYGALVEFCLLGLRAEVQRAREAARSGDEQQLEAARAQARSLLTRLGLLS